MSLEIQADRGAVLEWAQTAVESAGIDPATGRAILAFLLTAPRVARGFARFCGALDPLRGGGCYSAYQSQATITFNTEWYAFTGSLCRARGIEPWRVSTIELK